MHAPKPSPRNTLIATLLAILCSVVLAACGSGASQTMPVQQASAPRIMSFAANPASINSGSSSMLSWSASGATSLAITPGSFTSTSLSGSTSLTPTVTTTYTLTAANSSGSVTSTATVTVTASSPGAPVINSFSASPTSIAAGTSSTLSWNTTAATS